MKIHGYYFDLNGEKQLEFLDFTFINALIRCDIKLNIKLCILYR